MRLQYIEKTGVMFLFYVSQTHRCQIKVTNQWDHQIPAWVRCKFAHRFGNYTYSFPTGMQTNSTEDGGNVMLMNDPVTLHIKISNNTYSYSLIMREMKSLMIIYNNFRVVVEVTKLEKDFIKKYNDLKKVII